MSGSAESFATPAGGGGGGGISSSLDSVITVAVIDNDVIIPVANPVILRDNAVALVPLTVFQTGAGTAGIVVTDGVDDVRLLGDGRVHTADGTAPFPAHSFITQVDTGLYLDDSTIPMLGLSVAGENVMNIGPHDLPDASGILNLCTLEFDATAQATAGDGWRALTINMISQGAGNALRRFLDCQVASVSQMYVTNSGRVVASNGTVTSPSYVFVSELDVGIFRPAAGQLGLAANSQAVIVDNDAAQASFRPDVDATWDLGEAAIAWQNLFLTADATIGGDLIHTGTNIGFYGTAPAPQSAGYTLTAVAVPDRTLLASASATILNNNNVLAALITDLQAIGVLA